MKGITMGTSFDVEVTKKTYQDYLLFDRSDVDGEEIYVVGKDGQIIKIDTKIRFELPLVQFDNNFISAMNQIVLNRYESGTIFKMAVEEEGRVGFFSIIHIE